MQTLPVPQVVSGAVQALPVQQGCAGPPQVPQAPLLHSCPLGQLLPVPTQTPLMQQPPAPQVLAPQQRSPGSPQATQVLGEVRLQLVSEAMQRSPVQQGCPGAPQAPQVPFRQVAPVAVHTLPAQQGAPSSPQTTQVLVVESHAPAAVSQGRLPEQQG